MIKNWLYYQYRNNPKSYFLIENNNKFSFESFYFLVVDLAKSLDYNGLRKNQIVLILLTDPVSSLQCFFSCQQLGAIPVLVDSGKSSLELDGVIESLSPDLIITSWSNKINSKEVVFFEEIMSVKSGCRALKIIEKYSVDDVCCILCTTGTTGIAKLVRLSYGNFYSSFISWNNEINFKSEDRYLCCIPLYHIGGISIVMRSLFAGFSVDLCLPFKAKGVLNKLNKSVNYISLVPTMLSKLLDEGDISSHSLNAIIVGGSNIPNELLKKIIDYKLPVFKTYGMTESSSGIAGFFINKFLEKKDSSGKIFKNVEVKVKGGTISISGPMVMRGYFNQNLSKAIFHTDDIGSIDSDGYITVNGRKDRTILSGGKKISLVQIETILKLHPKVEMVKAFGVQDKDWGYRLMAAVNISGEVSSDELRRWVKKYLSSHCAPKGFMHGVNLIRGFNATLSEKEWQRINRESILIL